MNRKTKYLFGILLTIVIGMLLSWWLCCGTKADVTALGGDDQSNQTMAGQAATHEAFVLSDPDGNFNFRSEDNFNFNRSEADFITPVSAEVENGINRLRVFLAEAGNAGKSLDITGYYSGNEENYSDLPNLGLARANTVKDFLVTKGISSGQINTEGKLMEALVPDGNIFRGPLSFLMGSNASGSEASEATDQEMEAIVEHIKADPLVLYFGTAEASITLTPEQQQKMEDIRNYLNNVDGATVSIVGHTDNTGNRAANLQLGQKRAQIAKDYLVGNDIPDNKIVTASEGPDQPIANNSTEEGRAKNRRTVITLN